MTIIDGLTFTFERRRYGRQFFCWASVLNGQESLTLGDPWPASNWPKAELAKAVSWTLAGKVIVPAAVCGECGEFRWHRQGCSQWTPAVEVRPGVWESALVEVAA